MSRLGCGVFLSVSLFFITLGCSRGSAPTGSAVTEDPRARHRELRQTEAKTDRDRFSLSDQDALLMVDVQRYDLKGEFDWERGRLVAVAQVTLSLVDGKRDSIDLESRAAKVFSVLGKDKTPFPFVHVGSQLHISLADLSEEERLSPLVLEIRYEAFANQLRDGETSALNAVPVRMSDPVKARVAYTTSEPLGAIDWLPCHNVPSDRALFSVELTMRADERLIANGDLMDNKVTGDRRTMRYQTRYTLPTYNMAFAVGEFEMVQQMEGELPVSIWYRKGLPGSQAEVVGQIRHMIRSYQKLIGPFPFEKYSLVLLPEFPAGGIENASITFQAENRSTDSSSASDYGLTAHELGHQWFGDYVTVRTWDDLWIKEGMATLLAEEATRDFEDANHTGRLFGQNFWTSNGDAIRDPKLAADDKYTTGPYDRAAWLLTQIRSAAGEENFWRALREVLKRYAFSSVGTEDFVSHFSGYLDRTTYAKILGAIAAKRLPSVELLRSDEVSRVFHLEDPQGALIQPLMVRWLAEDGTLSEQVWEPGGELAIAAGEKRLLVIDPRDVQALLAFNWGKDTFEKYFVPLLTPRSAKQREQLLMLGAGSQSLGLRYDQEWEVSEKEAAEFYPRVAAESAKFQALARFCETARRHPSALWKSWVGQVLELPAWMGIPRSGVEEMEACADVYPGLFEVKWKALTESTPKGFGDRDLHFYTFFPQAFPASAAMWKNVYEKALSVRAQIQALTGLSRHGFAGTPFSVGDAEKAELKNTLRAILRTSDVTEAINALLGLNFLLDKEALPDLAALAKRLPRAGVQGRAICAAYTAAEKNKEKFAAFVKLLGPVENFPSSVQGTIAVPETKCR